MNPKQNGRTFSKGKTEGCKDRGQGRRCLLFFWLVFFAFCVNKDSDETFDRVEEEKKGAAEEKN